MAELTSARFPGGTLQGTRVRKMVGTAGFDSPWKLACQVVERAGYPSLAFEFGQAYWPVDDAAGGPRRCGPVVAAWRKAPSPRCSWSAVMRLSSRRRACLGTDRADMRPCAPAARPVAQGRRDSAAPTRQPSAAVVSEADLPDSSQARGGSHEPPRRRGGGHLLSGSAVRFHRSISAGLTWSHPGAVASGPVPRPGRSALRSHARSVRAAYLPRSAHPQAGKAGGWRESLPARRRPPRCGPR